MEATDIRRIANLAKLAAEPDEVARYAQDLTRILTLIEQMNAVDTAGVEPLAHPLELTQRLRPDLVTEEDGSALFQSIAPVTEDGFYLVPRVIEA